MASIKQIAAAIADKNDAKELRKLLENILTDTAALRAAHLLMSTKLDVLTAKLNADAGVTDTNYATDFATATNPAALTLTA